MGQFDPAVPLPSGQVAPVDAKGPPLVYPMPAATINAPGTIASSGSVTLGPFPADGMPHLAGSAELTNAGTIVLNRFLDAAHVVSIGTTTVAMTASTIALFDVNDGKVFQSFEMIVINGSASVGTLTNVNIVLAAS